MLNLQSNSKLIKAKGNKVLKNYSIFIILFVLFVLCSLLSDSFFTWRNMGNLIRQNTPIIFMSLGMLFAIITGGIDLSVGSMIALGGVSSAYVLTKLGWPVFTAFLVPLALTTIFGLIIGCLIAYAKMAPFVASLAIMTIGRGLAMYIANGTPIRLPANSIESIATIKILGGKLSGTWGEFTSLLGLFSLVIILIFWFIQKYTAYGRIALAIGSNETAVRLAGINVKSAKVSVYALSGLCSGFAGILLATRAQVGSPISGTGWELDAIASCVIGGASLMGGEGSVIKTVAGVFVLAFIGNIMNLLSVAAYPQDIIKGLIIITAVLLQSLQARGFKGEE